MLRPVSARSATVEGAVVTKALVRAAAQLGLSNKAAGRVIGVSEATMSRIGSGTYVLGRGDKPFELATLLIRLFRSLDAIVGGDQAVARAWLRAENSALGGRPIEKMQTVSGLVDVIAYLDARRAVV